MARRKTEDRFEATQKNADVLKSRTLDVPSEADIRMRAYQIFLARSGRPGSPEADWLQAEHELKQNGQPVGRK